MSTAHGAIDALERACATVTGHLRPSRERFEAMSFHDGAYDDGFDQAMHSPGRRAR